MIAASNPQGGSTVRRNEKPLRRATGAKVRWVARYTDRDGKRKSAGTFAKEGPCKKPTGDGQCCAQHAIWHAYETAPVVGVEARVTVGAYYQGVEPRDGWLDRHPRPERTEMGYRGRVAAVLEVDVEGQPFAAWPLADLKRKHIARLVDVMLRDHGRAASGTRAVVSVLSSMFEDAITDDVMEMNPAVGVRISDRDPRVRKAKRERVLASWEQMHAFARAAGPHEVMVRLLSDCGLRLGEMLALQASDDHRDFLVVERNAWHGVASPGTKQGKRREVPVPPGLRAVLDAYATPLRGPLFPSPSGGVWHERSFYRVVWYPARRASGLMLNPHDFRHSFVSHMRAAGVDPADLARASGQTVATATNIYTHSTGGTFDMMRKAVG